MKVDVGRQFTELELEQAERSAKSATAGMSAAARAEVVNRTHRVVRERASKIQNQRSKMRSLWIPLAVSASLMVVLVFAVWSAVSDFEATPSGLPESSQMLVLLMWSVPISVMVLAVVWFRRSHSGTENESTR